MRRIAVLSDIHGNLPALEAVLSDVRQAQADLVVLNGDLADGPFPAETLDLLTTLGDRAIWLRGNGDRWLAEAGAGGFDHPDRETRNLVGWASSQLSDAQRERLAALPPTHLHRHPLLGTIGVCHATSRSDNEMFLVDSSFAHCRQAFAGFDSDAVIVGHCHMPFDRMFDRRRVVNTGSVGMPYGHAGASWALIGSDIVLRRTAYDADLACARILRSGMPGAEEFARGNVRAPPSDEDAVAVFGEMRRKQQETGCFD